MSIAIITCSKKANDAYDMFKSFNEVLNCRLFEEIGHTSIEDGYNAGMERALADINVTHLFFTHSDVRNMASKYAFNRMFMHMTNAEGYTPGFYGVAGTTELLESGCWWEKHSGPVKHFGSIAHEDNGNLYQTVFGQGLYEKEVIVLDGVFLACRRDAVNNLDWTSTGFHFYDLDACLQMHVANKKNFVFNIPLIHRSIGKVDKSWFDARDIFVKGWKLPKSI